MSKIESVISELEVKYGRQFTQRQQINIFKKKLQEIKLDKVILKVAIRNGNSANFIFLSIHLCFLFNTVTPYDWYEHLDNFS